MQRKRYLELCQINAVYPKSKTVVHDGIEYYPQSFQILFDEHGATVDVGWMKDKKANCIVCRKVKEIAEKE